MANMLFTNNAATTLASSISSTATSLTVASGTGSLFPNPTGTQYFYCTLQATTGSTIEIIKVTARSSDTFTIIRGQDGTGGSSFTAGDKVELRIVAATMNDLPKLDEANSFSGTMGIGTTASSIYNLSVTGQSGQPAQLLTSFATSTGASGLLVNMLGGNNNAEIFQYNGANVGVILVSSTATTYLTSSDRRLKSDIVDLSDSGTLIDALKPRSFTWLPTGEKDTGFIADEVQTVIPNAVHGQPNEIDSQGKPLYQAVDMSTPEMIANIVAELQSLRKRVAALEAK